MKVGGRLVGTIRSRRMKVSESRCWFAIESKSFEISIDQAGWRLVGTITKRLCGVD